MYIKWQWPTTTAGNYTTFLLQEGSEIGR